MLQLESLPSKIDPVEGEILIETYLCALSDRILLSGKLFVSNMRLCFYSKFNSNNLFFGGTTIIIPKIDIDKVLRKSSGLLDNSLIIKTVNGNL